MFWNHLEESVYVSYFWYILRYKNMNLIKDFNFGNNINTADSKQREEDI